ncbi:GTPase activating protein [Kwoniella heveanensis BCC8398]|uniref:GTPase activating protein n=1 Tax=Kwoniella heveanensis BCC8398 TaxID=1296120 RepID=A0A1B9H1C4_9TREE|nr:GTPase activating protein [Kwoniella heveanensis BCC8398]
MAPVTLPPSFYNSFWSPDYRSGLEVLFKSLEQGCLENDDVEAFIDSQIRAHTTLSQTLLNPPISPTSAESSSSLQHTLLSLKGASSARGEAHKALANELEQRVLSGFRAWKERHEVRIKEARGDVLGKGGVVGLWEKEVQKLSGLKQTYQNKSRAADDSEDDAKFAPASALSPPPDHYTSSPKMVQTKTSHTNLRRAGTVADRISEKLRAAGASGIQQASPSSPSRRHQPTLSIDGKELPPPPSPLRPIAGSPDGGLHSPSSPTREERFVPPTDPDGKPWIHGAGGPPVPSKSNGPMSPSSDTSNQPILLSGLSLTSQALRDILQRFDASNAALASRQRSTILGTYEKTFSGEEVVEWLKDHVEGFGGDWERCVDAATELHKMGYFSRIGVGRGFDPSEETYYVLKINPSSTTTQASEALANLGLTSPLSPSTATNALPSLIKSYLPSSLANSDEPAHVRLRKDATKANELYKEGVRNAEERRLEMEEMIERGLRLWERWERERLAAVKTVLKHYEEALARLPSRLNDLQKSTSLSVEAYNPEADIKALIEGNRTGPFRPHPHIYESLESDIPDVNFGIDLRRWSGEHGWKSLVSAPPRPKGAVPEALEAMLRALNEMYSNVPDDERRKSWIYEVPLNETHMLRNAINNPQIPVDDMVTIIKKFNLPIAAGIVKLYLLELNPPVLGWEGWEDAKAVYPAVGADQERDMTSAVTSVLGRLPGSQLYALDAVIKHFRELIDSTKTPEADQVYVTKLALSVGRTILRPQFETELTIGDRTPSLFLADLINHYSALFPPLVEKKKRESDRVMPVRKRTALVDQRISRSSLSGEKDPQHLLELQHAMQHPVKGSSASSSPAGSTTAPQLPSVGSALGFGPPLQDYASSKKEDPFVASSATRISEPSKERERRADQPPQFKEPRSDSRSSTPTEGFRPPSIHETELATAPVSTSRTTDNRSSTPTEGFRPPSSQSYGSGSSAMHQAASHSRSATPTEGFVPPSDAATGPTPSATKSHEQAAINADDTVLAAGGSGGLKRAGSGEVSRLRGPRGARGPRPAGGRVPSHTATPSVASIITSYADDAAPGPASAGPVGAAGPGSANSSPAEQQSASAPGFRSRPTSPPMSTGAGPGSATGTGETGLKRASRTQFGHGTRGSVSAMAARFEKRDE